MPDCLAWIDDTHVAVRARAEAHVRVVGVLNPPVLEAVHELALLAVEREEALRVLAREGLDSPCELVGGQFGVAFPVTVANVVPVALEIAPRMLTAAPRRSSDARRVQLLVPDFGSANRAPEVGDRRASLGLVVHGFPHKSNVVAVSWNRLPALMYRLSMAADLSSVTA